MKQLLLIVSMLFFGILVRADVGYVAKGVYANAWIINTSAGNTLVDLVLPYSLWFDTIIVGGDVNGIASVEIVGVSKVKYYPFPAWVPVGDVFQDPIYVPALTHILVKLFEGASGNYTVTILGRLVTP
jgi:hypothetical protein